MKFKLALLCCLVFSHIYAEDMVEYDYELDAYYSNISAFIDLDTANELTDASTQSEVQIYTNLMLNTFNPNIFLVEASVHPMSIFGLYFRKFNEELYDYSEVQSFIFNFYTLYIW